MAKDRKAPKRARRTSGEGVPKSEREKAKSQDCGTPREDKRKSGRLIVRTPTARDREGL